MQQADRVRPAGNRHDHLLTFFKQPVLLNITQDPLFQCLFLLFPTHNTPIINSPADRNNLLISAFLWHNTLMPEGILTQEMISPEKTTDPDGFLKTESYLEDKESFFVLK